MENTKKCDIIILCEFYICMAHWKGQHMNTSREEFKAVINRIYERARKLDPNMQIDKENYELIINYGRELGREMDLVKKENAVSPTDKIYSAEQMDAFMEYVGAIISLYELCVTENTITKLASDMYAAICGASTQGG